MRIVRLSYKTEEDPLAGIKQLSELGIIVGVGLILEHFLSYDRWYDKDKDKCHGKAGLALLALSCIIRFSLDF